MSLRSLKPIYRSVTRPRTGSFEPKGDRKLGGFAPIANIRFWRRAVRYWVDTGQLAVG